MKKDILKIVILDGATLVGDGLSYDTMKKFGELIVYDRTSKGETITHIGDADIVLTNKVMIDKDVLDACPSIKFIGVLATGYNIVNTVYAREKNIVVSNIPTYWTDSVAQTTFALILELTTAVGKHSEAVHEGKRTSCKDWCFWLQPLTEIAGKTIGIIGYGNIWKIVGKIAKAFGMNVLFYNGTDLEGETDLLTLLQSSDIVTLHCPLTIDNKWFINKDTLAYMKPTAFLINTARGWLVKDDDLAHALNTGSIAGAGLDVVSTEPILETNPLLSARNCILTPHIARASKESRKRLLDFGIQNIEAFISGNPINVVN